MVLGAAGKSQRVLGALLAKLRRVLGPGVLAGRHELTLVPPANASIDLEVEELRLRALECVASSGLALAGAQLATAEAAARALISAEPIRERGYRLLMEVLPAHGEIAAALQTYEQLRVRLRDRAWGNAWRGDARHARAAARGR